MPSGVHWTGWLATQIHASQRDKTECMVRPPLTACAPAATRTITQCVMCASAAALVQSMHHKEMSNVDVGVQGQLWLPVWYLPWNLERLGGPPHRLAGIQAPPLLPAYRIRRVVLPIWS